MTVTDKASFLMKTFMAIFSPLGQPQKFCNGGTSCVSTGPDGQHSTIVHPQIELLNVSVTQLYSNSLRGGMPDEWKTAAVVNLDAG